MNIDLISFILPSIEHFHMAGYWMAFSAALLETTLGVGLFIPGSTIILILGTLSTSGHLDTGDLVWFAILGAILGDNINYYLGSRYGSQWLRQGFWFLKVSHIEKAKAFMNDHGAKSVFMGRFIPSVKEIVPFIAGSVKMNKKIFIFWNILGAIGWGLEWVLAGYFFGQSLALAKLWLSRAGLFFAFLVFTAVIVYLLKQLVTWKGRQVLEIAVSLFQSIREALIHNEHVHHWLEKYPRGIAFVQARFDTAVFSGLPLTIFILTFVYVLGLFVGIVEDLVTSDPIVAADVRVANLISSLRTDDLTTVFSWITLLGKSQVVLVFVLVLVVLLWIWRKRHLVLPLFIAVAGSVGFTYLGKLAFHRSRPQMPVYAEHSFSFPSGHSTIAVAFYGYVAYLLIRSVHGWNRRVNILFLSIFIILAIGFSRIYLGEHYISDVWSGYLVGAMWLVIAITFAEWLKQAECFDRNTPTDGRVRAISIFLAACAMLFYIGFSLKYEPPPAAPPLTKTLVVPQISDIFTSEQLKYTETLIGRKQEPVNAVFASINNNHLIDALQEAGWTLTDKADISSFTEAMRDLLTRTPHPSAPITPSFWNARIEDMSFAKLPESGNWLSNARHLRIWDTNSSANGNHIYIGMVNANNGFKWGVIPKISPDLDAQRELLYNDLKEAGKIEDYMKMRLVQSIIGKNFIGDQFFSDGKVYVFFLK